MGSLEGVKVGDKLFVSIGRHDYQLRKVAKLNKATVVDDRGVLWNTKDGYQRGRSTWDFDYAAKYDSEQHDEALDERRRARIRNNMTGVRWKDIDWEVVEACYKIVREADKKDEAKEAAQ